RRRGSLGIVLGMDERCDGTRDEGCFDGDGDSVVPVGEGLSSAQRELLVFERRWSGAVGLGGKEQEMRAVFGVTPTRYYQWLNAVVDLPAAMEFDPVLVKRLQRMRQGRARSRAVRRLVS
ncbi:DUF3263 domain-containing protein, partial [Dermatophilus congolensis]